MPVKQTITEPTRKDIADEIVLKGIDPAGRLAEDAFLARSFDLKALPTTDHRREFPDMAADVWQHRVNNRDWDDGWFWSDSRLNILRMPDEGFLRFLCEMLHPLVRDKPDERDALLSILNKHLAPEGWEIVETNRIGAHPLFAGRRIIRARVDPVTNAKAVAATLGDYVARQVTRMESALASGDLELAIGSAKEFIETVCRTILHERHVAIPATIDLPALVKSTAKHLQLVPAGIIDEQKWKGTVLKFVNNLSSSGQSLAELRNAFGTGHGKLADHKGLERHHARMVVGSAVTVGVFLFEVHDKNPPVS